MVFRVLRITFILFLIVCHSSARSYEYFDDYDNLSIESSEEGGSTGMAVPFSIIGAPVHFSGCPDGQTYIKKKCRKIRRG